MPDIAADGSCSWVEVNCDQVGVKLSRRSSESGAHWQCVREFGGSLSRPRIHVDAMGNWIVVFENCSNGVTYYSNSHDGGVTWADALPLAPGSQPELAASDGGMWRTVYAASSGAHTDIFTRTANLTAERVDEVTYEPFSSDVTNPQQGGTTGWTPFKASGNGTSTDYDAVAGALRVTVSSGTGNYCINGWMTGNSEWLPYSGTITSNSVVRGKFYVFRSGQADMAQLRQVPNMRMRLSTRFAVNSMLEAFNHLSGDTVGTSAGRELCPSSDPLNPSIYRVDLDPVDVPTLETAGEGISTGFEAYSLEDQENGSLELAEVVTGLYPRSLLADTGPRVKAARSLVCSDSDAGDLKVMNSQTDGPTFRKFVLSAPGVFGAEIGLEGASDPSYSEGSGGITLDSTAVATNRMAVVAREFSALGTNAERMRVEPMAQYVVRWHVTSPTNANRNPQLRLRARSLKFMWSQKYEVGGALAAGSLNNAIAQQALPGVGCANPDRAVTGESGGWYTLILHTPMSADIQPSQPYLAAQPGPGVDAVSMRDIKLGVDLLDTLSASAGSGAEGGQFTVDQIEMRAYDLVPD